MYMYSWLPHTIIGSVRFQYMYMYIHVHPSKATQWSSESVCVSGSSSLDYGKSILGCIHCTMVCYLLVPKYNVPGPVHVHVHVRRWGLNSEAVLYERGWLYVHVHVRCNSSLAYQGTSNTHGMVMVHVPLCFAPSIFSITIQPHVG